MNIAQPDMFRDYAPPAQRHSETSVAAAESVKGFVNAMRARVLAYLEANPSGATDEEIATALNMEGNTERPRRIELMTMGLVKDSGKKRKTRKGRLAAVWIKA